ncbi:MAG: aspartate 1-decarboxylase [Caulobacter sp.]|nr:aspartate 1-decarboxylase [Caulobacter sp.]
MTYAIRAQRGSGTISVNGSVARQAAVGNLIIIAAFGQLPADQVASFQPKLVFIDSANRIREERSTIAVQGL